MKTKTISIELNEVTKKWVKKYIEDGKLPNFKKILRNPQAVETLSEKEYKKLEPWIQWPSFYTGKSFNDHGCFNLGDSEKKINKTIYDDFQQREMNVLAISPMNCSFTQKNKSVFLPDPWSQQPFKNHFFLDKMWKAASKVVNTNDRLNLNFLDFVFLGCGFFLNVRPKSYFKFLKYLFLSFRYTWAKAIILDLLLMEVFIRFSRKKNLFSYCSVFLNAAAHIQHHYLYDSKCYEGLNSNPYEYSKASKTDIDPVYEILRNYDAFIHEINKMFDGDNIFISSGLQQTENEEPYYQYRPINHKELLKKLDINYKTVSPKMSRDMLINFHSSSQLKSAAEKLKKLEIQGQNFLNVDEDIENNSLFIKIGWRGPVSKLKDIKLNNRTIDLSKDFKVASIENSIHISKGWSYSSKNLFKSDLNIWDIRHLINGLNK
tara:strand:- start:964 stop:2259 length:1296 start_codon:yes stop_codon:yes gene_type:complete